MRLKKEANQSGSNGPSVLGPVTAGKSSYEVLLQSMADVALFTDSATVSKKRIDEILVTARTKLSDLTVDWEERLEYLKKIQRVAKDRTHDETLLNHLRFLTVPFQTSIKDLRSMVCWESCVTLAVVARELGHRSDPLIEPILTPLFNLLVATQKFVALTAKSTIRMILENVKSPRLLFQLGSLSQSKSKEIRRMAVKSVDVVLENWPEKIIKKHGQTFIDIIQKSVTDADSETRELTREVFPKFIGLFPEPGETIIDRLNGITKKKLMPLIVIGNKIKGRSQSLYARNPIEEAENRIDTGRKGKTARINRPLPSGRHVTSNLRSRNPVRTIPPQVQIKSSRVSAPVKVPLKTWRK